MSRKTLKKEQPELANEKFQGNKYFKTILLSYYMLTRNVNVLPAYEKLKDEKLLSDLFEEYKRYVAGYDLNIFLEEGKDQSSFKVPEFTTIKSSSILQILKKNPKF